jgi:hypothetical protein
MPIFVQSKYFPHTNNLCPLRGPNSAPPFPGGCTLQFGTSGINKHFKLMFEMVFVWASWFYVLQYFEHKLVTENKISVN